LTFDVDGETAIVGSYPGYDRNLLAMSHQQYGPTIGVRRILAVLAEYGVTATFFVPGAIAERYPDMVTAIAEHGHEIGHHSYSHNPPIVLTASEQREDVERGLTALERFGVRPRGYRAPLWQITSETLDAVIEFGLVYDSSLMNSDAPFRLQTATGSLIELPPHWCLDDWEHYAYMLEPAIGTTVSPPAKALAVWNAELQGMLKYTGLFMLTNHPFLSGRPGRALALGSFIEQLLASDRIEIMTAAEIADRAGHDPQLEVIDVGSIPWS
jgi:peptidoglycan/xylan/chitin deacetylase (PgdA/CDA1 family)